MSQPHLLKSIIEALLGSKDDNPANMTALSIVILTKDVYGKPRKGEWNCGSVAGMFNFLTNSTYPEIAYTVNNVQDFVKTKSTRMKWKCTT